LHLQSKISSDWQISQEITNYRQLTVSALVSRNHPDDPADERDKSQSTADETKAEVWGACVSPLYKYAIWKSQLVHGVLMEYHEMITNCLV